MLFLALCLQAFLSTLPTAADDRFIIILQNNLLGTANKVMPRRLLQYTFSAEHAHSTENAGCGSTPEASTKFCIDPDE